MRKLIVLLLGAVSVFAADPFRFAVLGDRTGSTQPGVYEQVWSAISDRKPAFVLGVGDLVEGGKDATAEAEWEEWAKIMTPWKSVPFYPAPGNHDIWSAPSEVLFRKFTGRAPHYSFGSGPVHVTVLDNSRTDDLAPSEYEFLEADLKAHADASVKIIVSHRPFWLFGVMLGDREARLQQLAKKYDVRYVIAGHVHAMLHGQLDGVDYVSMPSSGGHLRASAKYEDGWFFGYGWIEVVDGKATFRIRSVDGKETSIDDWGMAGLKANPTK